MTGAKGKSSKGGGGGGSSGRTRGPKHQNEFAFYHNPKSKLTQKILSSPNVGTCKRCHEKIEWRKKYRKYKPLSKPATCSTCHEKTVTAAYHKHCKPCANAKKICPSCGEKRQLVESSEAAPSYEREVEAVEAEARAVGMPLREKKTLLRELDRKYGKGKSQGGEDMEEEEEVDDADMAESKDEVMEGVIEAKAVEKIA